MPPIAVQVGGCSNCVCRLLHLDLCQTTISQVIADNPANYTAWICRWRCLRAGHGSKVV